MAQEVGHVHLGQQLLLSLMNVKQAGKATAGDIPYAVTADAVTLKGTERCATL